VAPRPLVALVARTWGAIGRIVQMLGCGRMKEQEIKASNEDRCILRYSFGLLGPCTPKRNPGRTIHILQSTTLCVLNKRYAGKDHSSSDDIPMGSSVPYRKS
jgi:hypothetical protein